MARDWRFGWQLDWQDKTDYWEWTEAFEWSREMPCYVLMNEFWERNHRWGQRQW